jgi:hypothetical protein
VTRVAAAADAAGERLPVLPRPHRDETADSYLRRLATANHLRFSYLGQYLVTPRGSYGPPSAPTNWPPSPTASRTPSSGPSPNCPPAPGPGTRHDPRQGSQRSKTQAATREKYAAIRRDDANGMSERAIERKHRVGRRTIVKSLASAEPPQRPDHRGAGGRASRPSPPGAPRRQCAARHPRPHYGPLPVHAARDDRRAARSGHCRRRRRR